jgi:hypothetical protein
MRLPAVTTVPGEQWRSIVQDDQVHLAGPEPARQPTCQAQASVEACVAAREPLTVEQHADVDIALPVRAPVSVATEEVDGEHTFGWELAESPQQHRQQIIRRRIGHDERR